MHYPTVSLLFLMTTFSSTYSMDLLIELEDTIIVHALYQENYAKVSAIPCVCRRWNQFANSPEVIKMIPGALSFLNIAGVKKYRKLHVDLLLSCLCHEKSIIKKEQDDFVKKMESYFKNPYFNINNSNVQRAFSVAAGKHQAYLLALFLEHGVNPNIKVTSGDGNELLLKIIDRRSNSDIISAAKECLSLLHKNGARDSGNIALSSALGQLQYFAWTVESQLAICPAFSVLVKMAENINANDNKGKNTFLHRILNLNIVVKKEMVIIFMRDGNANPHIKNKNGDTAYDLARAIARKDNKAEILTVIRDCDKGIAWYDEQEKIRQAAQND